MGEFLRTWGALIIALVALVQPWLRAAWRHLIWKPKLIPHPAGTIEFGFSSLGPTLGLLGTLECRRRQTFVRSMDVEVVRLKDRSSHRFSWGIFRSLAFGTANQTFELSSGFLARPEEPYRYNVQFWERTFQNELRPKLEALRQVWQERVLQQFGEDLQAVASGSAAAPAAAELRGKFEELYRQFSREDLHVSTYGSLQRMCYWEPGSYRIELRVATARPDALHTASWEVLLEEKHVESLRSNILKVLQEACNQPYGQFNFAYLPYEVEQSGGNA